MSARDVNDLQRDGALPADPAALAVPANERARAVAEDEGRVSTVRQLICDAYDRATSPRERAREILTTGHWEIDRDTGGFTPGNVWVFGAKSSWGKSSSLVMFADENIKRGRRVLIVSSEDSRKLYGDRLLMRRARVDRYGFQTGKLTPDEHSRLAGVAARGEDVPVFLDAIGKTVEWAAKRVKQLIAAEAIDLVAWDYLHAFDKEKRIDGDRRATLNYIARVMTDTTKAANVAGLIYGQVTPDTKAQVPDMYEIRDSKDVVNAAEVVAIGYVPAQAVMRSKQGETPVTIAQEGERCVVIAKNKPGPGPKGRIYRMGSDERHGCFDVVEDPNEELARRFDASGVGWMDALDH